MDGYRESGGIAGAVAASADRVYAGLSDEQRGQLRWLMLRMAGLAEAGEPVRTSIDRDVALSEPDRARVLDLLVRTRLVTSDQESFELAHEALVRAWPRLRTWLDEDRVAQRTWRHLSAAADEWAALDRASSELYSGVRLAAALEWAARPESMPTDLEREFLEASRGRADADRQELALQARHERRQNRRLRVLLAGLAVVLVAAMVAGVLAVLQARRADRQSLAATASEVGASALKTDDPQLSLLLAAAAQQVSPTAETLRSLSSAVASRPLLSRVASVPQSDQFGFVTANRDRVFVIDRHHIVRAFDADLRPVGTYDAGDGHSATIDPPLTTNDDVLVVPGAPGDPRPIRLLDPAKLTEVPNQLRDTPTNVFIIDVSLSADGRSLAVVYAPATGVSPVEIDEYNRIRVWDLATGLPAGPSIEVAGRWTGAGLSPHGRTVYSSTPVAAYDVASGETKWETDVATWNNAMEVRGRMLVTATAGFDGEFPGVQTFDTRTGKHGMTMPGDIGSIQEITVSRDGREIAATGVTGRAMVWDSESGQTLDTLETGGPPITGGAFSADGGTLYVAKPLRQQLQAWSLDGSDMFVQRVGFDQLPAFTNGEARLNQDGTRLAMAGWTDGDLEHLRLMMFDLTTQKRRELPVIGNEWLRAGAWDPTGDRYAAGYGGGWVQVIDADSAIEVNRRRVSDRGIVAVAYAGAERLLAATEDGQVLPLDAGSLEPVGTPVALSEDVAALAGFSDGRTAMVLGAGADLRVTWAKEGRTWYRLDLVSGRVVQTGQLTMRQGLVLAVAPDERRVAFGGAGGQVEIVDLGSGRSIRPAVSDGAGDMHHLAFDASGDRLLTGSGGRQLGVWDVRTGTPLGAANLVADMPPPVVAYAADGRVLAATRFGDVYVWDTSADAAVGYACRVAGRDLTRQEWVDAFGDEVPYRSVCGVG